MVISLEMFIFSYHCIVLASGLQAAAENSPKTPQQDPPPCKCVLICVRVHTHTRYSKEISLVPGSYHAYLFESQNPHPTIAPLIELSGF